jgi:hypothetical protein
MLVSTNVETAHWQEVKLFIKFLHKSITVQRVKERRYNLFTLLKKILNKRNVQGICNQ